MSNAKLDKGHLIGGKRPRAISDEILFDRHLLRDEANINFGKPLSYALR